MPRVTIDFGKNSGVVKPMYAVNNGPLPVSVRGTFDNGLYRASGIPYARNHDASFC